LARRWTSRVHVESLAVQEQLGRLSNKVQENLSGMAVVRAYTMEPAEVEAFRRLNDEQLGRTLRLARSQAVFSPLMGAIAGSGGLIVLSLGGGGGLQGGVALGGLLGLPGSLAYPAPPPPAVRLG